MTLIPALALIEEPQLPGALTARPLRGAHTSRLIRLISRPTSPRRPAIEALAALIRKCIPAALPKPLA
jgi:LysR family hydrogen peroxide-inducible transcriptional activator